MQINKLQENPPLVEIFLEVTILTFQNGFVVAPGNDLIISPHYLKEQYQANQASQANQSTNSIPDNVDIARTPVHVG